MNLKTIAALGFAAALTAFATAPASANVSGDGMGRTVSDDATTSQRCGCGYVRYYRVYRVYRVYPAVRVYRIRYYI
jgi:hypothetical protein